jgi:hypothetical protein
MPANALKSCVPVLKTRYISLYEFYWSINCVDLVLFTCQEKNHKYRLKQIHKQRLATIGLIETSAMLHTA